MKTTKYWKSESNKQAVDLAQCKRNQFWLPETLDTRKRNPMYCFSFLTKTSGSNDAYCLKVDLNSKCFLKQIWMYRYLKRSSKGGCFYIIIWAALWDTHIIILLVSVYLGPLICFPLNATGKQLVMVPVLEFSLPRQ